MLTTLPHLVLLAALPPLLASRQSGLKGLMAGCWEQVLVRGSPAQELLMALNRRCSTGFHFEAPRGWCATVTTTCFRQVLMAKPARG